MVLPRWKQAIVVGIGVQAFGCSDSVLRGQSYEETLALSGFGDPLAGLTAAEIARFEAGKDAFVEVETIDDGLGPVFNDSACANCHVAPAGSGSTRLETRFGTTTNGQFDPLTQLGGSLIQERGIGRVRSCNYVGEVVPAAATIVAKRRTTPLFGLGLVDAVPESTLRALAASQAQNTPGIAGIVSLVTDLSTNRLAVGKFGWKAQVPTLFQFSGDAYLNEMGITNPEFPDESCPQGNCDLLKCNPVPALNDDGGDVAAFTDFMTFLAPPPRGPINDDVKNGEKTFDKIGCNGCHVDTLTTGASASAALDHVTFHPYSDFLLHDMDSLGDGIQQNRATGRLMRTAPLWGLRAIQTLLHDGRTSDRTAAILAHDGQAKSSRDAFVALSSAQRSKVLVFLSSL
jgi:CxxC motif-containing protein (DUF1111 family)